MHPIFGNGEDQNVIQIYLHIVVRCMPGHTPKAAWVAALLGQVGVADGCDNWAGELRKNVWGKWLSKGNGHALI